MLNSVCPETSGYIESLSVTLYSRGCVCIPHTQRQEVILCAGVPPALSSCKWKCILMPLYLLSSQAGCHLESNTHTALAKKDMGMHLHIYHIFSSFKTMCVSMRKRHNDVGVYWRHISLFPCAYFMVGVHNLHI